MTDRGTQIAQEAEGWYGGILVEFAPEVTGEDARAFLDRMKQTIESAGQLTVRKALVTGPNGDGRRG